MSKFVTTWLNAAAASVSVFAGVPYAPAVPRTDERDEASAQLVLPLGGPQKRQTRLHASYGERAKAA